MGMRIDLADVVKSYGPQIALDELSLSIGGGERLALVGHNGAGKTTLIKLVLGLTNPTSGTVRVDGVDPNGASGAAVRRGMGFLPENVVFQGAATGRQVLRFYAKLKGAARAEVPNLLETVGLGEVADHRIGTYSKGMRQRLGLAQTLLGRPDALLLDEPTTGLDPAVKRRFYERLGTMAATGTTIMLSSHALTELAFSTDRIAIMSRGRLVAQGSLSDLAELAGLPVRFRVSVPPGGAGPMSERIGGVPTLKRVNDRYIELWCANNQKMEMLRHLAGLGSEISDIEIDPPTLDDIYASLRERSLAS